MKKVIEYELVEVKVGSAVSYLANCVDRVILKYLSDGWQPLGGPISTFNGHIARMYQAMVKYEEYILDDGSMCSDE